MAIRTVVLVFLCALAAIFFVVNWQGIMAPVAVNLLYTEVQAPLGLILLLVLGGLWVIAILWALVQHAALLADIRKAYKEVRSSKALADDAEHSRLESARKALEEAFNGAGQKQKERDEKLSGDLSALGQKIELLTLQLRTIAETAKITLPEKLPEETEKKGFFGFLSHKETVEEQPKDGEVQAQEKEPNKEGANSEGAKEPVSGGGLEDNGEEKTGQKDGFFKKLLK